MEQNGTNKQSSLYLVQRAEAMLGVLRYYLHGGGASLERHLYFLAQIDFWEWELDNLIYSFTNFAERSQTWGNTQAAVRKLGQLGIALDAKLVKKVRWHRGWRVQLENRRVAPADLLTEVVVQWNALIELIERQFVLPMQEKARKYNIQTRTDLQGLRRTVPSLDAGNEEQ